MNSLIDEISDDELSQLVFEPQETERSIQTMPSDVFERVRQFIVLYRNLGAQPLGAGLLYQRGGKEEGQFQPLERKLTVGRFSKSTYHPTGCDPDHVTALRATPSLAEESRLIKNWFGNTGLSQEIIRR